MRRAGRVRRWPLLAAGGLLLTVSACGTGRSAAPAASTTPPPTTPSVAATTTGPYVPPTLPTPATTGPLRATAVGSFLEVGLPVNGVETPRAAEAPDGTLFLATGTDVVSVVDGTHAPVVAEHADAAVYALAADAGSLYVATAKDVTRYDRTSGRVVRSWPVVVAAVTGGDSLQDSGTRLWAQTTDGGALVEIDPAATATRTVAAPGAILSFATDATGAYYVRPGGRVLVHVDLAGTSTTAPTGETVNVALSGADAVHAVTVVGNTLVVDHDAGQGEDSSLITFDTRTLGRLAAVGTDLAGARVASTLAGPLVAGVGTGCAVTTGSCVSRTVLATAQASQAYALPTGQAVAAVLGPYPVLITLPTTGPQHDEVYRLQ